MGQKSSRFTRQPSSGKNPLKRLTATSFGKFSVKQPEDEGRVWVTGLLCVSDKIVVVDGTNCMLKLFDQAGIHLSSIESKQIPWGITHVHDNMFATCGNGKKVHLWTVRGHVITSQNSSFNVDHPALRIHFNGSFFSLLHTTIMAITLLDKEGGLVRKIYKSEGLERKITFGRDIHLDAETNNIFVISTEDSGVLCMTMEGQTQWFCPLPLAFSIDEMNGALCVADPWNKCIYLITKEGRRVKKILQKYLKGPPVRVEYGHYDKLYVSYDQNDKRHKIVSVYTITHN